jgi:ribose 5-phosphate isomerase RpiB
VAKLLVKTWLESFFTGGPSAKKVEKIMSLEGA